jgi:hypothetical protein
MKIIKKYFLSFILFLGLTFYSCDDTLTVENVDDKDIPASNVSFADHIYPVLQVKCAFSGCHAQPNPADGIDLSTWSGVTTDPNIVFPYEPDLSRLVWTIDPSVSGVSKMPPIGYARPITLDQLEGIKKWIAEGALDN